MDYARMKATLKRHEGFRSKAYADPVGVMTIGYGRNLEAVGITEAEAEILLENDIAEAAASGRKIFGSAPWEAFGSIRQEAIANMLFNLGEPRFLTFKRAIAALTVADYPRAAVEMLDSRWAVQVGSRAQELAAMIDAGEMPAEVDP